jgi:hypothetical protein
MIRFFSILTGIFLLTAPLALAQETPVNDKADQKVEAEKAAADTSDSAIAAIDAFIAKQKIDRDGTKWKTGLQKPPQLDFESGKKYS